MKRVHLEIVLGTIFVFLSAAIIIAMSIDEPARLDKFLGEQSASQVEFGAGIFEINCTNCHGEYAQGIPGKAPCLRCAELFETRIDDLGWQGSLESYIVSVVTTGRQISTRPELYLGEGSGPPVMPTWSEAFGGPLRPDQVRAVAAFIVSFEEWALSPELVPTPLVSIGPDAPPELLGQLVFVGQGCIGCHTVEGLSTGAVGPILDGLASRAGDQVSDLSAEDYIRESIFNPGAFVVEGFADGLMPANFSDLIPEEDFENLVAFLLSLME